MRNSLFLMNEVLLSTILAVCGLLVNMFITLELHICIYLNIGMQNDDKLCRAPFWLVEVFSEKAHNS